MGLNANCLAAGCECSAECECVIPFCEIVQQHVEHHYKQMDHVDRIQIGHNVMRLTNVPTPAMPLHDLASKYLTFARVKLA